MTHLFLTNQLPHSSTNQTRRARGFSLVELMVGLTIGLIGSLVIFQVFAVNEQQKRRTTSLSDAQQGGSYALFDLEREVRMAGSGISPLDNLMGCIVNVNFNGTTTMPATSYPAPFSALNPTTRLLPLVVKNGDATADGTTPDIITVAYGSASAANTPMSFNDSGNPSNSTMPISNTLGINRGDLVLTALPTGGLCRVWQATGTAAPVTDGLVNMLPNPLKVEEITIAGEKWNGNNASLSTYGPTTQLISLGANPSISAFGVDPNRNELQMLDLMRGAAPTPVAENVVNLQALYGVDAGMLASGTPNGVINWVAPSGSYAASNLDLMLPTQRLTTVKAIRAVRIALVTRSPERDKEIVTPAIVTLFADAGASAITVNLDAEQQRYRYKVYDTVIPIRNLLFQ